MVPSVGHQETNHKHEDKPYGNNQWEPYFEMFHMLFDDF